MSSSITTKNTIIIGSDEAGKGEWLGPLTVAAVAVTPEQSSYLVTQGVMDSKKLKLEKIMELANVIKKNSLSYHIVTITPQRFNEFLLEVRDEGKSLNDILAWGHARAIEQVYEDLKSKNIRGSIKVVIDEFDRLKTERRLRRLLGPSALSLEQRPEAEQITAVAAAGILARAAREHWIDRESKRLKLNLRAISPREATTYKNADYFAKIAFLKQTR